jgi:DNA-binding beta-propeller fold protein YncE
MAFDGAHIWVSNNGSGTVTELRVTDDAVVGTFAVGKLPNGIAFDGANIWVANAGSNTVTKLRVSEAGNEPRLETFPVGSFPVNGVAIDGANIWVTNGVSNTISKL